MDFSKLSEFMDHLTQWKIPGNSIVVYNKGDMVFKYSSGYADVENQIKMTGNELLNIYSCSKVATVIAALQLYERGIFLLDDPIGEYIEEFKEMEVKGEDGQLKKAVTPITFRHLLTHTAGFNYNMGSESIKKLREKTNGRMPTIEVAKAMANEPLEYEPGTKWGYSVAHDVLGALVEVISQKKFSDYVKENIFNPIGIEDIYYHADKEVSDRMAQQYIYKSKDTVDNDIVKAQISSDKEGALFNQGKQNHHILGSEYDSGGAGIITSVSSYAKFANVLAMGGGPIISKGTIDLMRTNQLNSDQLKYINWSQLNGYGFGLGVRTMMDKAKGGCNGAIGEFGWGGAAGATLLVDRENELAYFYAHHMLNPHEDYYQPRLRNVVYSCL